MNNPWLICLFVTVSMIFQVPIMSVGWSRFWDGWPWFWVVWPFLLVIVLLAIEVLWPIALQVSAWSIWRRIRL